MVLETEMIARYVSSYMSDAIHERIKLAKACDRQLNEKLRVLEDDNIDENYRIVLLGILACTRKNDEDDVIERSKRLVAHDKRKEIIDISDGADLESDPLYELYLKHLKVHDKSYALEFEEDGSLVVVKYEEDIESIEEGDLEPAHIRIVESNRALTVAHEKIPEKQELRMLTRGFKRKCEPSDQMRGVENQCKLAKMGNTDRVGGQCYVKLGGDCNVSMHKGQTEVNEKIIHQKQTNGRNLLRALRPKSAFSNQMPQVENQRRVSNKKTESPAREKSRNETKRVENQHKADHQSILLNKTSNTDKVEHIDGPRKRQTGGNLPRAVRPKTEIPNQIPQVASAKKTKSTSQGKSRNEINREVNHVCMHKGRNMGFEYLSQMNHLKKQSGRDLCWKRKPKAEPPNEMHRLEKSCEFYSQPALAKNTKSLTPKTLINEAKNVRIEKFSAKELGKVKAEKCFMPYDTDTSDSEVEILDETACVKGGILNPFVPSKRFNISMEEDGIMHIGGSSGTDVFRKEVLDVLKKPYDREEYTRLREAFRDGGYLEYHPELMRKLKLQKYRYNRRRRLAIFRGFFFWLQNLTREGSIKPWKDSACLAVEPPRPRKF